MSFCPEAVPCVSWRFFPGHRSGDTFPPLCFLIAASRGARVCDPRSQDVINRRAQEDVVLDIGRDERIVGIEIMNASRKLDLQQILPVRFEPTG